MNLNPCISDSKVYCVLCLADFNKMDVWGTEGINRGVKKVHMWDKWSDIIGKFLFYLWFCLWFTFALKNKEKYILTGKIDFKSDFKFLSYFATVLLLSNLQLVLDRGERRRRWTWVESWLFNKILSLMEWSMVWKLVLHLLDHKSEWAMLSWQKPVAMC